MRDKIKLVSSAGTGHYYTTTKNKRTMPEKMEIKKFDPVHQEQAHHAGKNGNQKVRPGGTQACALQGSEDQVVCAQVPNMEPGIAGFFIGQFTSRIRLTAVTLQQ